MAAVKRGKDQRELDLVLIADLYISEGLSQQQIAARISEERDYTLTQQEISHDLKTLRKRWQSQADRPMEEELLKIDMVERELLQQYRENRDPLLLTLGVLRCVDRRCRLLGFLKPQPAPTFATKLELVWGNDGPVGVRAVVGTEDPGSLALAPSLAAGGDESPGAVQGSGVWEAMGED